MKCQHNKPADQNRFKVILRDYPYGFFADPETLKPLPLEIDFIVTADWLLSDSRSMRLTRNVAFVDPDGKVWRAGKNRVVDGLSSPRILWRIQPPFVGKAREGSVIHDIACKDKKHPSKEVHWVFWNAMRARRMHKVCAFLRWFSVRVGGPRFKGLPQGARE